MRFAGEQMRRIRLQKPATTRTGSGQRVIAWEDADEDPNPFAMVRDQRGAENYQSDKKTATLTKIFQLYKRDDLNEEWTILDEESGRRFDVARIHPMGNRKLDIEATWTQGQYND